MEPLPLTILALVIVAGLIAWRRMSARSHAPKREETPSPTVTGLPTEFPYQRKWYLLSRTERACYEALRAAAGQDLHVFPKVRLLELLWVPNETPQRQGYLNRVMSKHVDFVLCDRERVAPVLVVELDDASHKLPQRAARDALVDAVLRAAGLPVLRFPVSAAYAPGEVAVLLRTAIGRRDTQAPTGSPVRNTDAPS